MDFFKGPKDQSVICALLTAKTSRRAEEKQNSIGLQIVFTIVQNEMGPLINASVKISLVMKESRPCLEYGQVRGDVTWIESVLQNIKIT